MRILENEELRLEIADKGAELCRVWDKETACERLWHADPAIWNRHSPILFPFVGKVIDGKYRLNGREYEMKTQHGFARDMNFVCVEETDSSVSHLLCSTEETKKIYPFDFHLQIRHRLDKEMQRLLHIEWEVTNTGTETMYYSIGGHPGFMPPKEIDKEDCFLGFPGKEKLHYISADSAGFVIPDTVYELTLENNLAPVDESLPNTWIFENNQVHAVQLARPDKTPWITLHCEEFPILAVWANAAGPFICLEPWHGIPAEVTESGAFEDKKFVTILQPGATYVTWFDVTLDQ